jgi:hypothetical protein
VTRRIYTKRMIGRRHVINIGREDAEAKGRNLKEKMVAGNTLAEIDQFFVCTYNSDYRPEVQRSSPFIVHVIKYSKNNFVPYSISFPLILAVLLWRCPPSSTIRLIKWSHWLPPLFARRTWLFRIMFHILRIEDVYITRI